MIENSEQVWTCALLWKRMLELTRVGEFSEESIPNRLMDRFIDAINDVHRYHGLCGVLRARREDIMGGLSWEALKQVVRKDDIDRSSDKYERYQRKDIHKDRDEKDVYHRPSG